MLGAVVCGVLKGRSNHVLRLGRAISDSSNQAYLRRGCFAPMLRKPWHPIHRITFDRALGICRLSQHGTQVPASGFRRFPFSQVLLFRVPGFRFSLFPVPGSRVPLFSLSCSGFQVPGSRFRCSGFHHRLPATGYRLPPYLAYSTQRTSRRTVTRTSPGYSISSSIRRAMSRAILAETLSSTFSASTITRTSRPAWMA